MDLFRRAIAAGLFISLGGFIFASCPNKIVGAFMFAVGLLSVLCYGTELYTGVIGFCFIKRSHLNIHLVWLGNLIGCLSAACAVRFAFPQVGEACMQIASGKFAKCLPGSLPDACAWSLQGAATIVVSALFCGILMYLAVTGYKTLDSHHPVVRSFLVFLCVATFILCGFEHCIADMFFLVAGLGGVMPALDIALFILLATLGNALGSLVMYVLTYPRTARI